MLILSGIGQNELEYLIISVYAGELLMKILSINSQLNNKMQHFKGLWGAQEGDGDWATDRRTCEPPLLREFVTLKYYPFKDETVKETWNTTKEFRGIHKEFRVDDICSYDVERHTTVEVEKALPITKKEWAAFLANKYKLNPEMKASIEKTLKEFGLNKYIRSNPIKYIIAKLHI